MMKGVMMGILLCTQVYMAILIADLMGENNPLVAIPVISSILTVILILSSDSKF